jgi:hypothetical protein
MNESSRTGHSTCDLLYFTLARRYGASLITLDAKLKVLAINFGIDVIAWQTEASYCFVLENSQTLAAPVWSRFDTGTPLHSKKKQ